MLERTPYVLLLHCQPLICNAAGECPYVVYFCHDLGRVLTTAPHTQRSTAQHSTPHAVPANSASTCALWYASLCFVTRLAVSTPHAVHHAGYSPTLLDQLNPPCRLLQGYHLQTRPQGLVRCTNKQQCTTRSNAAQSLNSRWLPTGRCNKGHASLVVGIHSHSHPVCCCPLPCTPC